MNASRTRRIAAEDLVRLRRELKDLDGQRTVLARAADEARADLDSFARAGPARASHLTVRPALDPAPVGNVAAERAAVGGMGERRTRGRARQQEGQRRSRRDCTLRG